ncbi:MAG: hypothetical protein ACLFR1_01420 [Spirochaetia bacterium]
MHSDYRVTIDNESAVKIHVSKQTGPLTYETVWIFSLEGRAEPIVLNTFYTPEKFVVMDWNGFLRAFHAVTGEVIFTRDFAAQLDCRALVSRDGKKLYVSHNPDYRNPTLTVLSLKDFSQVAEHSLPKPIDLEFFRERKDGSLLYYYKERGYSKNSAGGRDKIYSHGYQVVDPETGERVHFSFPFPPLSMFVEVSPVLDICVFGR